MLSSVRIAAVVLALAISPIVTGCGADASLSPLGPSAGAGTSAGAVISGMVAGAGTASSIMSTEPTFRTLAGSSSITVKVTGTDISTTTDGQGRFTLTGVPSGTVEIQFTSPAGTAKISLSGVSSTDRIELTVTLNGNNARVDHENRHKDNNRVEANGRITAIDATARTLTVGTKQVRVPTTAVIRHGSRTLAFTDLHVGDHVEVKGKVDGTVIVADEVKVEAEDDDDDEDEDRNEVELKGAIAGLSATTGCPVVNFTVNTVKVTTSASTTFRGVACSALANAMKVEVKGTKQADGSVKATRVSRES